MTLDAVEHERRRRAYAASDTDAQAAAMLGITAGAMRTWRRNQGLPARASNGLLADEEQRRMQAYRTTSSDPEAAAILGISRTGFQGWRHRRCLPARSHNGWRTIDRHQLQWRSRFQRPARGIPLPRERHKRAAFIDRLVAREYPSCTSVSMLATTTGLSMNAVWRSLDRLGLHSPGLTGENLASLLRRLEVYLTTTTPRDYSLRLGIGTASGSRGIGALRARFDLPPIDAAHAIKDTHVKRVLDALEPERAHPDRARPWATVANK